jgi:hypothetical protein
MSWSPLISPSPSSLRAIDRGWDSVLIVLLLIEMTSFTVTLRCGGENDEL